MLPSDRDIEQLQSLLPQPLSHNQPDFQFIALFAGIGGIRRGFDAPGESAFRIPVSDTQAYQQFGNSVVVPVSRAIASMMKPQIMAAKQKLAKISPAAA